MTWDLMMRSFRVLRRDKQLVLFPVLSALAGLAVSVPFFLAIFTAREGLHWDTWTGVLGFAWYCAANFAMIFFNCALAASAQKFFDTGEASVGDGISQAASRTGSIFAWAVVSTTIGLLLRWVEDRSGWIGRIVIAVIGIGWTMVTFLIVPVLVIEDVGVMDSIRRSSDLLRRTWGEQLISGVTFMWAGLLCALPGIVIGAIGMNGFWPLIPVAVLYFVAMAAVFTAARQVFTVALYRYATTGQAPDGFTTLGLRNAIRPR
jgi:hypothetical protein